MPPPNRLAPDPYNSLYYSVPDPAALGPQYAPPMPLRQQVENVSAGLGRGVTTQLQDVQALLSDPRAYATNTMRSLRELVRNPALIGNVLHDTARRAASGPLGLGEVAGEMLPLGGRAKTPYVRSMAAWPAPTTTPKNAKLIMMSPQDYLDQVAAAQKKAFSDLPYPVRKPKTVEKLRKAIRAGETIETPWLTYKNGKIVDQEGRHRALAALQEGVEKIPVFVYEK